MLFLNFMKKNKKTIDEIFNSEELEVLENNNLIRKSKFNNTEKYIISDILNKWKKTLEVNKKVEKIPNKYRIKLI